MGILFSQVSDLENYNAKNPRSSKQMRFGDFSFWVVVYTHQVI